MTFIMLHTQGAGRGQQRLKGVVLDPEDKPLPSAKVVLTLKGYYKLEVNTKKVDFIPAGKTSQGIQKEMLTNEKGEFRFVGLGFGQWEVTATYGDLAPTRKLVVIDRGIATKPMTLRLKEKTNDPVVVASGTTDVPAAIEGIRKNAKKLFELGEELLEYDQLDKAVTCFLLAAKQKPKWSAPYLKLGYAYFNLGKNIKALENFNKFLELDPKSPEAPTVKEMVAILQEDVTSGLNGG
jgi:tetratricopeptide (TPR) repeat protein